MTRLRAWLIGLIVDAVLEALKRRDELIDDALADLRGTGGEEARARYEQLQHGRYW